MKKTDLLKASLICLATVSASTSLGSGFALYQGSAAGNADANYGTAKGGEPGSIYLNPAGITTVPGTQIQVGVIAVAPKATVEGTNPYTGEKYSQDGKENVWPIPHAYVTHQLNDAWWLGLGMYTRFGLGSHFNDKWFGRYNSFSAEITSFNVNPTVAWKAADWISVSAGLSIQYFDITLKQKIDAAGIAKLRNYNDPVYSPYDIYQEMSADDVGVGIDLGVMMNPVDKVNVGIAYHSQIEQNCSGKAEYTKPAPVAAMMPTYFNDTGIAGKVTLPDMIMSAITYDVTEKLTVGLGLTYTAWSTYEELKINFDEPILPGKTQSVSEKDWDDVWRYTVGMTYAYDEALTLRGSYTYDDSPFNNKNLDYIIPADDRHIFAIGAGYKMDQWVFDLCYFYELIEDKNVSAKVASGVMPSKFVDGSAHSLGFSVTRKF